MSHLPKEAFLFQYNFTLDGKNKSDINVDYLQYLSCHVPFRKVCLYIYTSSPALLVFQQIIGPLMCEICDR